MENKVKKIFPIEERNKSLEDMFRANGFDAQVVGNPNKPIVVIDGNYAISGFCKNWYFNFTTKPYGGEIVKTIHIKGRDTEITHSMIEKMIEQTVKRSLFKIICSFGDNDTLFFNDMRNGNVYFSDKDAKYFFLEEKADKMAELLKDEDYIPTVVEGHFV